MTVKALLNLRLDLKNNPFKIKTKWLDQFTGSTSALAHLTPRPVKGLFADNYINFQDNTFKQWSQQFLPEVYEKEVERYGNRTIGGFLRIVGAEMPMASDQVIWQEQGRLHIAYEGVDSDWLLLLTLHGLSQLPESTLSA
jgi:hypothetical protein